MEIMMAFARFFISSFSEEVVKAVAQAALMDQDEGYVSWSEHRVLMQKVADMKGLTTPHSQYKCDCMSYQVTDDCYELAEKLLKESGFNTQLFFSFVSWMNHDTKEVLVSALKKS